MGNENVELGIHNPHHSSLSFNITMETGLIF